MIQKIVHKLRLMWLLRFDPVGFARAIGVQVGERCRILNIQPNTFGSEPWLIRLGDHVEVTSGVRFITHDGGMWVFRERSPNIDIFGPIIVGDNVFIGINAILMPGVKIGNNCVVGAGAVVTRDIPDNTVAIGVPARPLKTMDEYWQASQQRAFYIRNYSPSERKRHLREHFGL